MLTTDDLLDAIVRRFQSDPTILSAVLFGSRARMRPGLGAADGWSDIDLHVISSAPHTLADHTWAESLPGTELCLHCIHPISMAIKRVSMLFTAGEVNVVLLPASLLRPIRWATKVNLHRRWRFLRNQLNPMATVMRGGYRFIKGEKKWGDFYSRISNELTGRRIDDAAATSMADAFLFDFVRLLNKIKRAELVDAQRVLHNSLLEINLRLLEEIRDRKGTLTYGGARKAEKILSAGELARIQVGARLQGDELRTAAWGARKAMEEFLAELVPDWRPPAALDELSDKPQPIFL